jgi:glycosyltransferase involved in cell wall biosynthesis
MEAMRVFVFSYDFYPTCVGEPQVAVKEVTDRVFSSGLEYHVLTVRAKPDQKKTEWLGNTLVHRVGLGLIDVVKAGPKLKAISYALFVPLVSIRTALLCRKHRHNAIWCATASMAIPAGILHSFGLRVPYVISVHDNESLRNLMSQWYARPIRAVVRYAFAHAATIHVVSDALADWVKKEGAECPVVVLPNGLDAAHYKTHYSDEELNAVQVQLRKSSGDTMLVSTTPLETESGIDTVLQALTQLPENVKYAILGSGPAEGALRKQVADLKLDARVTFVGAVSHADLPKYFRACEVFVCTHRVSCPKKLLAEAMAAFLPVVATRPSGNADLLYDPQHDPGKEQTVWIVDKDAPKQVAETIHAIRWQTSGVSKVLMNAHALVEEQYRWDKVAEEMYQKVLKMLLHTQLPSRK